MIKNKLKTLLCSSVQKLQLYLNRTCNRSYGEVSWKPPMGICTGLKMYNCIAKQNVAVSFQNKNKVSFYICGPTVYDAPHLGHASCYMKLDIIQRILKHHFNLNLVTSMNITDIDDKIISKSIETGQHWKDIVKENEIQFFNDMKKLNIAEPDVVLRVTENMDHIINFIVGLIEKKMAYVTQNGCVYFDVRKYKNYGRLQKVNIYDSTQPKEIYTGVKDEGKLFDADFALWKSKKYEYEPVWESPWGLGRPGWHIECSALASHLFGSKIDIHAGGIDLRFPHHENEETQSCVFHGTDQWVNYWMHVGHLHIKGDLNKMSKSLKNTISVDDMLRNYDCNEFRMACLLSNYKNQMEYSDDMMKTASNTLRKFRNFESDCLAYISGVKPAVNIRTYDLMANLDYASKEVLTSLCNDFNTSYAMTILLDLISNVSRCVNNVDSGQVVESSGLDSVVACNKYIQNTMSMFGISGKKVKEFEEKSKTLDSNIYMENDQILTEILQFRSFLRQNALAKKNPILFDVSDVIRDSLIRHGINVKDYEKGTVWEYAAKINK